MELDKNRLARQEEIVEKWTAANGQGTLEAVTGFGKSYVGILGIRVAQGHKPDRIIHVVTPGNDIKRDWEKRLREHKIQHAVVFTIHTYITERRECSVLILDEIHNYAAPTFKAVFRICQYKFIFGFTATLARNDGKHFLLQQKAPIVDVVTLAEARREEYISDFVVYNLALEQTVADKESYDKLHKLFNKLFGRFGYDFDTMLKCSFGKAKGGNEIRLHYARERGWTTSDGQDDMWSPTSIGRYAQQAMSTMRKRKNWIYNAPGKIDATVEIIARFPKAKVITFAQTTEFADNLTEAIGNVARAYHTNLETIMVEGKKMGKTKRKREALRLFNDGRSNVRVLSTAKALDEGFDAPDIDLAIICSATSTPRQTIQRIGRAVRFKPGKKAIIVNLYLKDTQDSNWLKSRTKTTVNMINIYEIEQIGLPRTEIESNVALDTAEQRPVFRLKG